MCIVRVVVWLCRSRRTDIAARAARRSSARTAPTQRAHFPAPYFSLRTWRGAAGDLDVRRYKQTLLQVAGTSKQRAGQAVVAKVPEHMQQNANARRVLFNRTRVDCLHVPEDSEEKIMDVHVSGCERRYRLLHVMKKS